MEQVSGRAGRKDQQGHVMIQVANTRHPVLQYVQLHDYEMFYKQEIEARKQFFYPPFSRIILITFKHKMKEITEAAAHSMAAALKPAFEQYLVGPAEPVVNRIRNQFLMELLIKLPKDAKTINLCKKTIHDQIAVLHNDKRFRSVVILPDVDAV
jgi:primosomal protein N' (replication factor Y)